MSTASMDLAPLEHQHRLRQAIRRDVLFLAAGLIAYAIVAYVETHAADIEIRGNFIKALSSKLEYSSHCNADIDGICSVEVHRTGILDAGFILTSPLHRYLLEHRDVNDLLAMINSMLLTIPLAYVIYITIWRGDFTLSFRLISTHLFRSLCGWFT